MKGFAGMTKAFFFDFISPICHKAIDVRIFVWVAGTHLGVNPIS